MECLAASACANNQLVFFRLPVSLSILKLFWGLTVLSSDN